MLTFTPIGSLGSPGFCHEETKEPRANTQDHCFFCFWTHNLVFVLTTAQLCWHIYIYIFKGHAHPKYVHKGDFTRTIIPLSIGMCFQLREWLCCTVKCYFLCTMGRYGLGYEQTRIICVSEHTKRASSSPSNCKMFAVQNCMSVMLL